MDILPENLNPAIIEVAKRNPMVKEIVTAYLHGVEVADDRVLTWRDALELMVVKLDDQYVGMTQAANDISFKKKETQLALVNEKEQPCPECNSLTWFVDAKDGRRKCALCDARRGRRNVVYQNQLLRKAMLEMATSHTRRGSEKLQKTLERILAIEPNLPKQ